MPDGGLFTPDQITRGTNDPPRPTAAASLANRGWYRYRNGAEKPAPEAAPAKATPATPATTPPGSSTPADSHAKTLGGLRAATSASNADGWLAWGAKDPKRTPAQKREQETAHRVALGRIAGPQVGDDNRV